MVRVAVLLAAVFTATNAFAQVEYVEDSMVDFSGGYALSRSSGITSNGWYGDVALRVYRSLFAVGGVSRSYLSDTSVVNGNPVKISASSYSVGGGPRVFLIPRRSFINPFVDVLLNFGHARNVISNLGSGSPGSASIKGFGLDIGGGADFRINHFFSVRVRPGYSIARAEGETENGFALLTGIVFHFKILPIQ